MGERWYSPGWTRTNNPPVQQIDRGYVLPGFAAWLSGKVTLGDARFSPEPCDLGASVAARTLEAKPAPPSPQTPLRESGGGFALQPLPTLLAA